MERLLLIGAGGHACSVLDSLERFDYDEIGICDQPETVGQKLYGIPIIGSDTDLERLYAEGFTQAVVAFGSIGSPQNRVAMYRRLKKIGYRLPIVKDRSSAVSKRSWIEEGTFIGKGTVINIGAQIGKMCIINSGAVVDHDCKIGDFVHIAPGCSMSGGITVGIGAHVGTGACVIQGIHIGNNAVIGAGSVVLHEVPPGATVVGNPGRIIKSTAKGGKYG